MSARRSDSDRRVSTTNGEFGFEQNSMILNKPLNALVVPGGSLTLFLLPREL